MGKWLRNAWVLMWLPWGVHSGALTGLTSLDDPDLVEGLRNRVEAGLTSGMLSAAEEPILARQALPAFYEERGFLPVWIDETGLTSGAEELLGALHESGDDGLRSSDYHLAAIDSLASRLGMGGEDGLRMRIDAELLLTDAFLLFGSHLLMGRVNPETINPEWIANRRGVDMAQVLAELVEGGDVRATLDALRPDRTRYRNLRSALARLRELREAGGWGTISGGGGMELGSRDPRVVELRGRLRRSGDLGPAVSEDAEPELFDAELDAAVRGFQSRHGLTADGIVGSATTAALNVSVEARISQLEVNLERWRWLPQDLGDRHFMVNIAAFSVELFEGGESVRQLRAIVGRPFRQTPVFSGDMTYLVLAPYWHVPPGIAQHDQLPRIREDPGAVAAQRMVLLEQGTNHRVDPYTVDWEGMTGAEFNRRYRLRQDPGPHNSLGDVKFMFPNRFNVYLHDTPARDLFTRTVRDLSSGCVRVQDALDLAHHLLREDPSWTPERIREVVAQGVERNVRLPTPYRVHLQYWTAWVDDRGVLQFRDDIYERDVRVRRALEASPPPL